ncbi:unnamed protein product, partial [Ectocarpus sp. 4 AP-2014]
MAGRPSSAATGYGGETTLALQPNNQGAEEGGGGGGRGSFIAASPPSPTPPSPPSTRGVCKIDGRAEE